MVLWRRLVVLSLTGVIFLAAYATGRYYSSDLVLFVVTNAVIEKSPPGMNPEMIRRRLAALGEAHGGRTALESSLAISQRLEKMQRLTPAEAEEIIQEAEGSARAGQK